MTPKAHFPRLAIVIALVVMTSACAVALTEPFDAPSSSSRDPAEATTTSAAPSATVPRNTATRPPTPPEAIVEACRLPNRTSDPIDGDPVTLSVQAARALICSTTDVVVSPVDRPIEAARVARTLGAPLVYASSDTPFDPRPFGAARVWTEDAALVVGGDHAVLPLPDPQEPPHPMAASSTHGEVTDDAVRLSIDRSPEDVSTLMIVSRSRPELGPAVAATAEAGGATPVWTGRGDMRRRRALAPLARSSESRLLVGDFSGASPWQTDVLAGGKELPGGGQILFGNKRLVALYGHPHTSALGVLGERPLPETIAHAAEVAEPYQGEGVEVVPTLEIIATVATAGAGGDGDYSAELSVEDLRPWVEAAAEAGYYVVLDLQSGRSDFLAQAKRYEELLELPHVGLALDPEWRLGADQTHLGQIGSVSAAEVNQVVDWLAALVRRHRLPQKLLVVHQFRLSMVTDRGDIRVPGELSVVIHMDGQGPRATKYDTWNALQEADNRDWSWGWKNFYDEDSPTPTPGQVLDLEPQPVFISYQ